jgi:hypothetical protein
MACHSLFEDPNGMAANYINVKEGMRAETV